MTMDFFAEAYELQVLFGASVDNRLVGKAGKGLVLTTFLSIFQLSDVPSFKLEGLFVRSSSCLCLVLSGRGWFFCCAVDVVSNFCSYEHCIAGCVMVPTLALRGRLSHVVR
jgi:hypothetical protein